MEMSHLISLSIIFYDNYEQRTIAFFDIKSDCVIM